LSNSFFIIAVISIEDAQFSTPMTEKMALRRYKRRVLYKATVALLEVYYHMSAFPAMAEYDFPVKKGLTFWKPLLTVTGKNL
jgi:hypothetical protein